MQEYIAQLKSQIEACGDEIEAGRQLPPSLVDDLTAAGAFRALIPKCFGGLEMGFLDYLATIEAIASSDASTAWCVNQAAVIGLTSLWLPEEKIAEIWAGTDTRIANGPPFSGSLTADGEGFVLEGHWGFSSGCQHATWMMGAARFSEGGWRIAYFKPEQVEFLDNWQTDGLRGTGSFEFSVNQVWLPKNQVADVGQKATHINTLTIVPGALLFAVSFASVAIGVAQASLDDVLTIAQSKKPRYASLHLRDDPDVQRFIGKASARLKAARAYLHTTVGQVLSEVESTKQIDHVLRSELRLAGTHVIREAAQVVDLAYKISGSTGIYKDQPLHRRVQDMQVITQHVQARESNFALLGRYYLSGEYELGPMT